MFGITSIDAPYELSSRIFLACFRLSSVSFPLNITVVVSSSFAPLSTIFSYASLIDARSSCRFSTSMNLLRYSREALNQSLSALANRVIRCLTNLIALALLASRSVGSIPLNIPMLLPLNTTVS